MGQHTGGPGYTLFLDQITRAWWLCSRLSHTLSRLHEEITVTIVVKIVVVVLHSSHKIKNNSSELVLVCIVQSAFLAEQQLIARAGSEQSGPSHQKTTSPYPSHRWLRPEPTFQRLMQCLRDLEPCQQPFRRPNVISGHTFGGSADCVANALA